MLVDDVCRALVAIQCVPDEVPLLPVDEGDALKARFFLEKTLFSSQYIKREISLRQAVQYVLLKRSYRKWIEDGINFQASLRFMYRLRKLKDGI